MQKKQETTKLKHPAGRPSEYTQEKADLICDRVATHDYGLGRLCRMYPDMPDEKTIYRWKYKNESFCQQYARAKMKQADLLAEKCLEISEDANYQDVAVARLRVDTRKWLASKLLPKQYGDRVLLEQKTEENEQLKEELLALRAKLDEQNKREY